MNHRSIVRFLKAADQMESWFAMSPYNTPDEAEYHGADIVVDDEDLRWAVKESPLLTQTLFGAQVMVRVTCFDDSALRSDMLLESPTTWGDFKAARGADGLRDLVVAVKASYKDLSPKAEA